MAHLARDHAADRVERVVAELGAEALVEVGDGVSALTRKRPSGCGWISLEASSMSCSSSMSADDLLKARPRS